MPIVPSSFGPARPDQFSALKARVARVIGGSQEGPILTAAGEALNEAIMEFNSRVYECNKIGPVPVTCSAGVGTLPTAFFKEHECALMDTLGNRVRQLNYMDWGEFEHTFSFSQAGLFAAGTVGYYTLFNIFKTGQIKLLPEAAFSLTSTDTVSITYYRRFPLMAEDEDVLDAPQEIQRALMLWAQADMLRLFRSSDQQTWSATHAMAEQAWARFISIDQRHPDAKPRFRLAPLSSNSFLGGDVVYIRG